MFSSAARNAFKTGARMLSSGAAQTVKSQRFMMGASAVAVGVAAGVATHQADCLKVEIDDATAKKLLGALSAAKGDTGPRYNELLPAPAGATVKACVVE